MAHSYFNRSEGEFVPNPDPEGPLAMMPPLDPSIKEFFINIPPELGSLVQNLFQDAVAVPYMGQDVEGIRLTLSPVAAKHFASNLANDLKKALVFREMLNSAGLSREEQLAFAEEMFNKSKRG